MKKDAEGRVTRRGFLEAAAVVAAAGKTAEAVSLESSDQTGDPERERLEKLVASYGSELGNLRKVE